jgi:hypothetical protein
MTYYRGNAASVLAGIPVSRLLRELRRIYCVDVIAS